jgi:hypothetical protein
MLDGLTTSTTVMRPASPCPRPYCGGSILMDDGEARCLLCGRPGDNDEVGAVSAPRRARWYQGPPSPACCWGERTGGADPREDGTVDPLDVAPLRM